MSAETAPDRSGAPSPLIPYLATPLGALGQAAQLAPLATDPRFPWHPAVARRGVEIGRAMEAMTGTDCGPAVLREGLAGLRRMLDGIEAWRAHPARRPAEDRPVLAAFGNTRLLDYSEKGASGRRVLLVPSLVNQAYVLDILPDRSVIRFLAGRGMRPVLLDWGVPDRESRDFDLGDYVVQRVLPALAHLADAEPPALLGYCLGGTMAVAAATLRPAAIRRLALIGAPWDFHAAGGLIAAAGRVTSGAPDDQLGQLIVSAGIVFGAVPALWVQEIFAQLDPLQAARKFRRFAEMDPASEEARLFVATEDWLADGPPLAAPAARELLIDLLRENRTRHGLWRVGGQKIDARAVTVPTLVAAAQRDHITPPGAAEPLARLIPGARLIRPDAGHVGMILGRRARETLWEPLAEALRD